MAARSFLLDNDLIEGNRILFSEAKDPSKWSIGRLNLSKWLEQKLLSRFEECGSFTDLGPILLGSWSRHELCPRSDIDLIFLGPEEKVKEFSSKAFKQGIKLRARVPEDLHDWTVGVEPVDMLAVISAVAFNPAEENILPVQGAKAKLQKRIILKAIRAERDERRHRLDSISSFLEPNLKYGAGGIRDIEQALALASLFPEKFKN